MGETTLNKKMRAFDDEVALTVAPFYLVHMLQRTFPAGFIAPCLPTKLINCRWFSSGGPRRRTVFQRRLATLPLATYQAGETVRTRRAALGGETATCVSPTSASSRPPLDANVPDIAGGGDGARNMTTGEPKMTEMSKPAEILYRAFFDELRFAKQQQWTITNYLLLLMGAGFGLFKLTSPSPTQCEKVVWSALAAGVVVTGLFLLLHLQRHMHTTRARQWRMEDTFSPEDRSLARNEPVLSEYYIRT
jgi:hypothetical protein